MTPDEWVVAWIDEDGDLEEVYHFPSVEAASEFVVSHPTRRGDRGYWSMAALRDPPEVDGP